jgi:hypothetical protein
MEKVKKGNLSYNKISSPVLEWILLRFDMDRIYERRYHL